MLLIIGTVRLPPERLGEAKVAMARMIAATRAEDGCLAYSYSEDVLEPGLIHVIERWQDRASLERHFAMPHIAEWRTAWPALEIGERNLMLYEAGTPAPI